MKQALGDVEKLLIKCEREESFTAMFEALGDRQEQDEIRKRDEDKHHCSILKESPYGCSALPRDVSGHLGEFKAGTPCPNNPYIRFAEKIAQQEARNSLVDRAMDVYRASRAGVMDHTASSVEVTMAFTLADWFELKKQELMWQGKLSNSL